VGRAEVVRMAATTVDQLLDEGRPADAAAIAAEAAALAPQEVERLAPALLTLARRHAAGAGGPSGALRAPGAP